MSAPKSNTYIESVILEEIDKILLKENPGEEPVKIVDHHLDALKSAGAEDIFHKNARFDPNNNLQISKLFKTLGKTYLFYTDPLRLAPLTIAQQLEGDFEHIEKYSQKEGYSRISALIIHKMKRNFVAKIEEKFFAANGFWKETGLWLEKPDEVTVAKPGQGDRYDKLASMIAKPSGPGNTGSTQTVLRYLRKNNNGQYKFSRYRSKVEKRALNINFWHKFFNSLLTIAAAAVQEQGDKKLYALDKEAFLKAGMPKQVFNQAFWPAIAGSLGDDRMPNRANNGRRIILKALWDSLRSPVSLKQDTWNALNAPAAKAPGTKGTDLPPEVTSAIVKGTGTEPKKAPQEEAPNDTVTRLPMDQLKGFTKKPFWCPSNPKKGHEKAFCSNNTLWAKEELNRSLYKKILNQLPKTLEEHRTSINEQKDINTQDDLRANIRAYLQQRKKAGDNVAKQEELLDQRIEFFNNLAKRKKIDVESAYTDLPVAGDAKARGYSGLSLKAFGSTAKSAFKRMGSALGLGSSKGEKVPLPPKPTGSELVNLTFQCKGGSKDTPFGKEVCKDEKLKALDARHNQLFKAMRSYGIPKSVLAANKEFNRGKANLDPMDRPTVFRYLMTYITKLEEEVWPQVTSGGKKSATGRSRSGSRSGGRSGSRRSSGGRGVGGNTRYQQKLLQGLKDGPKTIKDLQAGLKQYFLKSELTFNKAGEPDGKVGGETKTAIKQLQKQLVTMNALPKIDPDTKRSSVDGLYGEKTHEASRKAKVGIFFQDAKAKVSDNPVDQARAMVQASANYKKAEIDYKANKKAMQPMIDKIRKNEVEGTFKKFDSMGKKYWLYAVPGRDEPYIDYNHIGKYPGTSDMAHKLYLLKQAGEHSVTKESKQVNNLINIINQEIDNILFEQKRGKKRRKYARGFKGRIQRQQVLLKSINRGSGEEITMTDIQFALAKKYPKFEAALKKKGGLGDYNRLTMRAIMKFQKEYRKQLGQKSKFNPKGGAKIDGLVGPNTFGVMTKVFPKLRKLGDQKGMTVSDDKSVLDALDKIGGAKPGKARLQAYMKMVMDNPKQFYKIYVQLSKERKKYTKATDAERQEVWDLEKSPEADERELAAIKATNEQNTPLMQDIASAAADTKQKFDPARETANARSTRKRDEYFSALVKAYYMAVDLCFKRPKTICRGTGRS